MEREITFIGRAVLFIGILTTFAIMLATQLSSESIQAYTKDGKIVLLDTETMSWDFYKDKITSEHGLLFSNDELKISNYGIKLIGSGQQKLKPSYKVSLKLEVINPTKILRYKSHDIWASQDGSNSGYYPTGIEVLDSYGNEIEVCEASINGNKSVMFESTYALYPFEPVNMEIGLCAKLLEKTNYLEVKMRNVFDFSIPKNGSLATLLKGNEVRFKLPVGGLTASFSP